MDFRLQDGIVFFGDSDIGNYFAELMTQREQVEKQAQHRKFDIITLTQDWSALAQCLIPTYPVIDAKRIAISLAGQEVQIVSIEELYENNHKEIFYTIETQDGLMYCFPERLCY